MKNKLVEDFQTIKNSLGSNFSSIHLFGSYAKDKSNASDIDIMIRVKEKRNSVEIIQKLNNLNVPIGKITYNCYDTYKGHIPKYDIVIVADGDLSGYFYQINKSNFIKIME